MAARISHPIPALERSASMPSFHILSWSPAQGWACLSAGIRGGQDRRGPCLLFLVGADGQLTIPIPRSLWHTDITLVAVISYFWTFTHGSICPRANRDFGRLSNLAKVIRPVKSWAGTWPEFVWLEAGVLNHYAPPDLLNPSVWQWRAIERQELCFNNWHHHLDHLTVATLGPSFTAIHFLRLCGAEHLKSCGTVWHTD